MSFLDYKHPSLAAQEEDYQLVHRFYTGEDINLELVQRKQGESPQQFQERQRLVHFHPYTASVLDTVAGLPFAHIQEVTRGWGSLGEPENKSSIAHTLFNDIDGSGLDWEVMLHMAALKLLMYQKVWCLVDGPSLNTDVTETEARVRLFAPTAVPNWIESVSGGLEQVLVKESVIDRSSIMDEPKLIDQYVLYEPSSWSRWRSDKDGKAVMVESASYAEDGRPYVTRGGAPVAPIFSIELPFKRYIAAQLARSHRALLNIESDRDSLLRAASYPKLQLVGSDAEVKSIADALKKGANVIQSNPEHSRGHSYEGPPTDGASELTKVLDQKQKTFSETAWKLLDAESRIQITATEAALDRSEGVGPIVSLLCGALEELETNAMFLLEQAYSSNPSNWTSTSEWPRDLATKVIAEVQ